MQLTSKQHIRGTALNSNSGPPEPRAGDPVCMECAQVSVLSKQIRECDFLAEALKVKFYIWHPGLFFFFNAFIQTSHLVQKELALGQH